MKKVRWIVMVCMIMALVGMGRVDVKAVDSDSGDGFLYFDNEDGTISISGYYGNEETIIFPSVLKGKPVTTICLNYYGFSWDRDTVKHIVISEGISEIIVRSSDSYDSGAFRGCKNLETVFLPSTLTTIGDYAFISCENLNHVILPENLAEIGVAAFEHCYSLDRLEIPDSVIKIGKDAFYLGQSKYIPIYTNPGSYTHTYVKENNIPFSCMEHKNIVIDPEIPATCTEEGLTAGSHCSICNTIISMGEATPPKGHTIVVKPGKPATCTTYGYPPSYVCSVCGESLSGSASIPPTAHKIITIYTPPTCTQYSKTETYCEVCNQKDIDDYGEPYVSYPKPPTGHKYDKGTLNIKTGKKLLTCTICGDQQYQDITLSDLPQIGDIISNAQDSYHVVKGGWQDRSVAFYKTQSTKSHITIPDTVTIDDITYKVILIDDNAFRNNKKVTHVTIGKNVTFIGKCAFLGCSRLKSVTIGSNVDGIDNQAFMNCGKLKTLTVKSKKITYIGKNALKGIHPKAKIKVPAKKLKKYRKIFKKKGQKTSVCITS